MDVVRGSTENCIKYVGFVIIFVGWYVVVLIYFWCRFCKRERDMLKIKVYIYFVFVWWKVCKFFIYNLMFFVLR